MTDLLGQPSIKDLAMIPPLAFFSEVRKKDIYILKNSEGRIRQKAQAKVERNGPNRKGKTGDRLVASKKMKPKLNGGDGDRNSLSDVPMAIGRFQYH